MNRLNPFLAVAVLSTILLASCVSYDIDPAGTVGEVVVMEGVTILVDPGADALIAIAVRNDNPYEVEVNLRALGGEIGYNASSSSSFASFSSGNNRILAAWLTNPGTAVLAPNQEILMTAFMKNWNRATRKFTSRIEVIVKRTDYPSARLTVRVDENDVFEDAARLFQSNKLGQNNPSSYGARYGKVGDLPDDYELTLQPAE